ncbi:3,4-dihydroxy-2-butanone-4-phosphate synthase [Haloglomus litoreum]|uniref:3,4-dihydroxy-2-butanone-4-phosphate synthase n=1 Tax=Haloglomus litoreum TaxID=3034026 RepID=UPI0023E87C21|nr:3,4-dihydroxy-2-butanone-4-phosphate synthase [Haloglomus sp. DT116]
MSQSEPVPEAASSVERAVRAFRTGSPVLVHDFDDREGETDLVYPAAAVTPADVARLRNDAGGLVCVALDEATAAAFDLPFLADEFDHPAASSDHLSYDERSSFSLTVNHRDTRTGIPDEDRALTISELGAAAAAPASVDFAATFRAPGHVHLLRGASGLLAERRGHTELSLALARAAGRAPATVVCEMLDDETGRALPPTAARNYARAENLVYVEGRDIVAELQ